MNGVQILSPFFGLFGALFMYGIEGFFMALHSGEEGGT